MALLSVVRRPSENVAILNIMALLRAVRRRSEYHGHDLGFASGRPSEYHGAT